MWTYDFLFDVTAKRLFTLKYKINKADIEKQMF